MSPVYSLWSFTCSISQPSNSPLGIGNSGPIVQVRRGSERLEDLPKVTSLRDHAGWLAGFWAWPLSAIPSGFSVFSVQNELFLGHTGWRPQDPFLTVCHTAFITRQRAPWGFFRVHSTQHKTSNRFHLNDTSWNDKRIRESRIIDAYSSSRGSKESDTTEHKCTHTHTHTHV